MSDSNAYDVFAQNIASGYGYCWKPGELTAYWAVGTSALYALLYSVFGHSYTPIVMLNILVGLGTIALAMSLTRRWLGQFPAVLTGWILALWPQMIEFTTILASEMLFNFCVLLAFWLATLPGWKWFPRAAASGIALAAAVYIRPVALLLAPLIYLPEALNRGELAKALAACMISCVIMVALVLPWSVRNLHVFDHFVLVSTNAGANFWMGNNPNSTGGYMVLPETGIANEAERDRYFNQKAWEYIRLEPLAFVARTVKKTFMLHDRETIGVSWNEKGLEQRFGSDILFPLKLLNNPYWWLILVCASYGLVLLFQQRTWLEFLTLPPLTTWAYFTALHSITVSGDRYHIPSDPFIAMLAAYAISEIALRLGTPKENDFAN
jgi:4-amino-4-deoxy-L-arabinose transferase-like glycosyltransferase